MHDFIPREVARLFEQLYQVEQPRAAWLAGVLSTLRPHLDRGLGVQGYFVDMASPGSFQAEGFQALGMDATEARQRFDAWAEATPTDVKRSIHSFGPCALGAELPRRAGITQEDLAATQAHGYLEMFGINGVDAAGRGAAIAVPHLTKPGASRVARRDVWARVATHIAGASRLIRRLERESSPQPSQGDAVLDGRGRLEDGPIDAHSGPVREALRTAAVAIDRARGSRIRRDDAEVTQLWRALVEGRWSLVEQFDRGGRRYIVAYRNNPRPDARLSLLSAREEQVVRAASLGHSNKLIAYELGLGPSTVASHLSRAAKKLGAEGRVALIRAYRERER